MKIFIMVLIGFYLIGCVSIDKNKDFYGKQILYKDVKGILEDFGRDNVLFLAEPPGVLSRILIVSEKDMIELDLRFNNLPNSLLMKPLINNKPWVINDFLNYVPYKITKRKINEEYLKKIKYRNSFK
ncbi:hypothetical protein ABIC56_001414 [Acinetobacter bereziniae]|uniref:hypothetical protein n=1 Tax=Acinetobacter bereziniae TaxID=106648 RepID=UPI0028546614|nr:hypothetical protein [Acinetobacter bereziniae]MDR6541393.1 hypothetical protein [Acinetobacter bereziniae]